MASQRKERKEVHHPLFARWYRRIGVAADRAGAAAHRERLVAGLHGRVVEVGAGSGLNFRHYPIGVTEVVAVEPEPYMRTSAAEAARSASVRVQVVDGTADALPLADASVDAGVVSLVLCSVPNQTRALAELWRVIRAGGELRFYEHVAAETPARARLQRRLDPIWTRCSGGCHLTRCTAEAIEAAGFTIEHCERFDFQPCILGAPAAPHILGVARR